MEKTLSREVEEEAQDFAWVSLSEAKNYDLIDGIYEELELADKKLRGEVVPVGQNLILLFI